MFNIKKDIIIKSISNYQLVKLYYCNSSQFILNLKTYF